MTTTVTPKRSADQTSSTIEGIANMQNDTPSTRPQSADEDKNECFCGAFKFSHEEVCRQCDEYQNIRAKQEQARKRAARYGRIW